MTTKLKKKLWYEIRSFIKVFLSTFLVLAKVEINTIFSGDFSKAALAGLGAAALNALLKVCQTLLFPSVPTSLNSDLVLKSKEPKAD